MGVQVNKKESILAFCFDSAAKATKRYKSKDLDCV